MPLVTVICLCFNHQKFLKEALDSVVSQTYKNLEIIIVDDASTDKSKEIIEDYIRKYPFIQFISNKINLGNCASFNKALRIAKGKYVIDLATDDVLFEDRISKQVVAFEGLDASHAAIFTDGYYINENGQFLHFHYRNKNGELLSNVPSGNIYKEILANNGFICSPTVMFRKEILEFIGGYDEDLNFEDFDVFLRLARHFKFHFLDEVLTYRRVSQNSHGKTALLEKNKSTFKICCKALWLNKDEAEHYALSQFVKFNLRYSFYLEDFTMAEKYWLLLRNYGNISIQESCIYYLIKSRIRIFNLYRLYTKVKYGYFISK